MVEVLGREQLMVESHQKRKHVGVFHKFRVGPKNGWFIMENLEHSLKLDDFLWTQGQGVFYEVEVGVDRNS